MTNFKSEADPFSVNENSGTYSEKFVKSQREHNLFLASFSNLKLLCRLSSNADQNRYLSVQCFALAKPEG